MQLNKYVAADKVTSRDVSHDHAGNGVTGACRSVELRTESAFHQDRALKTMKLMEEVVTRKNLNRAYERVISNEGAAGIDGMKTTELKTWIVENKEELIKQLLEGTYWPSPVRRVDIPKPDGGTRRLGIPTVRDRMVQQALLQVLDPILDPLFSEFSYGFRQGRSCHQALKKAQEYVKEGREYVVDMDLEKFFDNVNHDILMSRLAKHIGDKRILKIVRRFLQGGIMYNGACTAGETGTPQGGPLSPLLANLLLDDLDKELERRGHKFVRYADDCNIYVRSEKAGKRVMESVTQFLKEKLRLTVNCQKSAVSPCDGRTFLGYTILVDGRLVISEKSVNRIKDKIRMITRRNRGVSLETIITELNKIIPGWVQYFKLAQAKKPLTRIDEWLRRKLRCYRFKQLKNPRTKVKRLTALGVTVQKAWFVALSSKGLWRLSATQQMHEAMNLGWFKEQGLKSFLEYYESLISKC